MTGDSVPRFIACLVAIALVSPQSGAEDKIDEGTVKAIHRAYQDASRQLDPVHVYYKITLIETPEWVRVTSSGKKDQNREVAGRIFQLEAEYARSGLKIMSRAKRLDLDNGRPPPSEWERESFWLYNGQVAVRKSNQENTYLITKNATPNWMAELPTSVSRGDTLLKTLDEWLTAPNTVVGTKTEDRVACQKVLLLDLVYPESKWKNTIRLLPERGFTISQFESIDSNRRPVDIAEVTDFHDVNGIHYPKKVTAKHYMSHSRLGYTQILEVSSVLTEARQIPDGMFRFEFPPGSQVWDEDTKTMVRQSELTESHLREVVRQLAPTPSLWKRWWFLGGACAGVTLLLVGLRYVVRRRGRTAVTEAGAPGGGTHAAS